jgi:hypothetical protein
MKFGLHILLMMMTLWTALMPAHASCCPHASEMPVSVNEIVATIDEAMPPCHKQHGASHAMATEHADSAIDDAQSQGSCEIQCHLSIFLPPAVQVLGSAVVRQDSEEVPRPVLAAYSRSLLRPPSFIPS